jgi:hypothetical protein
VWTDQRPKAKLEAGVTIDRLLGEAKAISHHLKSARP